MELADLQCPFQPNPIWDSVALPPSLGTFQQRMKIIKDLLQPKNEGKELRGRRAQSAQPVVAPDPPAVLRTSPPEGPTSPGAAASTRGCLKEQNQSDTVPQ